MNDLLHIDECQIYAAKTRRTFCIADCSDARKSRESALAAAAERERVLQTENEAMRRALIQTVTCYDGEGAVMQTYKRCRVCLWGERNTAVNEHQDYCPLALAPTTTEDA